MSKTFKRVNQITTLLALCLLLVSQVSAQTAVALPSAQEITRKVDDYMAAAMRVNRFSGAVLLARDGQPIESRGYGMANIELSVP
jgi:CubicO group peptidase (beta-lactamase class C family)